jgi:hypothetical protein
MRRSCPGRTSSRRSEQEILFRQGLDIMIGGRREEVGGETQGLLRPKQLVLEQAGDPRYLIGPHFLEATWKLNRLCYLSGFQSPVAMLSSAFSRFGRREIPPQQTRDKAEQLYMGQDSQAQPGYLLRA